MDDNMKKEIKELYEVNELCNLLKDENVPEIAFFIESKKKNQIVFRREKEVIKMHLFLYNYLKKQKLDDEIFSFFENETEVKEIIVYDDNKNNLKISFKK